MADLRRLRDRLASTPTTLPPTGLVPVACDTCGARFVDNDLGRDAHLVVFGHRPPVLERHGDRCRCEQCLPVLDGEVLDEQDDAP
jgi:hypothetical protein